MQLTLVAHYGAKPLAFANLVARWQDGCAAVLRESFRPYALEAVHATVVGLEGRVVSDGVLQEAYARHGGTRIMDLPGLLRHTVTSDAWPLRVRLGGFGAADEYPFTSRGRHPYERSLAIQPTGAVVVIGWPARAHGFPNTLDRFRRELAAFNAVHKYHDTPAAVDNDFFFVAGKADPQAAAAARSSDALRALRDELACTPFELEVTVDDLFVVAYTDPELPPNSRRVPVREALDRVPELLAMYRE
jgi:hypothetical protein